MNLSKTLFNHGSKKGIYIITSIFIALTLLRFIAEVIPPLWFLLLILYALLPFLIIKKDQRIGIGLKKPISNRYLIIGIFLSVGMKALTIAFLFLSFGSSESNWMISIVEHYRHLPSMPVVAIVFTIIFSVGVPLAEELFFRMVQSIWAIKYTSTCAIIISAAFFGLSHIDQYIFDFNLLGIFLRFIPITLYGLIHAWVYHKTTSTYSSMITHIFGNLFEAIILVYVIMPLL